jgi:tetratricopeptide (TPR) repeat protein
MTKRGIVIWFLFSLVIISCQKDGGTSEDKTASQLVAEAWTAFSAGDYQTAVDRCNEAIAKDGNLVDAYNGAGWSNAKLNALATSVTQFNAGLAKDPSNLDMKAGLAFVFNAQKNYSQSITFANQVIQTNSSWSFSRNGAISVADLRLLLAENYFSQPGPNYALSLQQVQLLNPSFVADVATVAGQSALASEIERLRPIV